MSNLSELLPTGGGQNAVDFVASGTLSSGQAVVLKADGTVEAIGELAESVGSPSVFESATTEYTSVTYDPVNNKVVITYTDADNSDYGTAVVGTISGTSISFGAPVVFASGASLFMVSTFDSISNQVIVAFRYAGIRGSAILGTVSGTSISFGSRADFELANSVAIAVSFDPSANRVVVAYRDTVNANYGTAAVGTVSGTSISFGTPVVFESAYSNYTTLTYDPVNNKTVLAYSDIGNSGYATAIVGTVSGTSISFGTPVVFESALTSYISSTYDSSANKVVMAYRDEGNSGYGTAIVGTVSGTSISFGSPVTFSTVDTYYISTVFNTYSNNVVISYLDFSNLDGKVLSGTVSGTSISFEDPIIFNLSRSNYVSAAYNSLADRVIIAYQDVGNSDYGTSVVYVPLGASNNVDFIGITAEAISDTATGTVNVYGGINEAQTGLTIGADYYVQGDGSLSTTASAVKVGQAISATTINMMDLT